jgi:hypothetical protein
MVDLGGPWIFMLEISSWYAITRHAQLIEQATDDATKAKLAGELAAHLLRIEAQRQGNGVAIPAPKRRR